MDEGVGVQAFEGDGGGEGVVGMGIEVGGGEEEDGAKPFAAGAEGVVNTLMDNRRGCGFGGEEIGQGLFGGLAIPLEGGFKVFHGEKLYFGVEIVVGCSRGRREKGRGKWRIRKN